MLLKTWKYIFHYNIGSSELSHPPLLLWVEPTNRCNLRCTMCPNSLSGKSREPGFMDMKLYEKIVRESSGWCGIFYLFLAGESLMHRQLPEMIALAEKSGIRVVLHTNGCLLTRERSEKIIDAGLREISFSFDALDVEEYEKRRAGADFGKTLENIREFIAVKNEKKSRLPKITIQCIDFSGKAGRAGRKRMLKLFPGLRAKNINVIQPHTWAGMFKDDDSLAAPPKAGVYFPCKFPWASMSIAWNGDVVGCCNDLFGEIRLGDANKEPLREIWNNKAMQRFRQALTAQRFTEYPLCKDCDVPFNHNNARSPVRWARSLRNRCLAGWLSLGIELARRGLAAVKNAGKGNK